MHSQCILLLPSGKIWLQRLSRAPVSICLLLFAILGLFSIQSHAQADSRDVSSLHSDEGSALSETTLSSSNYEQALALAAAPSEDCWEMGGISRYLLGNTWVTYLGLSYYNDWLGRHGWTYGAVSNMKSNAICGLKATSICDRIGTIYKDSAGNISTQSWPDNLVEAPMDVYGPDRENYIRVGFPGKDSMCPGRCGPGCIGEFHEDWHNFSPVTYTAECFAHDLCTGAVTGSNPNPNIFVGEKHACVDEFVAASKSYQHGPECKSNVKLSSFFGWWRFFFTLNDKNRYFKLTSKNVFEANRSPVNQKKLGTYFVIKNIEGNLVLQVQQVNKGYLFKNDLAVYSALIGPRSGFPRVLDLTEGATTNDNKNKFYFKGNKLFYGGSVRDKDGHALSNVKIKITATSGERSGTSTALSGGVDGDFYWKGPEPYTKYKAVFSKTGYKSLSLKNVSNYIMQGNLHEVTLDYEEQRNCTYSQTGTDDTASPFNAACYPETYGIFPHDQSRGVAFYTQVGCTYRITSDSAWLKFFDWTEVGEDGHAVVKSELSGRASPGWPVGSQFYAASTADANMQCFGPSRVAHFTVSGQGGFSATYEVTQYSCSCPLVRWKSK